MVGATGFEPATSCTPCKRATKLRYAPTPAQARESSSPLRNALAPFACRTAAEESLGDRGYGSPVFEDRNDRGRDRQFDAKARRKCESAMGCRDPFDGRADRCDGGSDCFA